MLKPDLAKRVEHHASARQRPIPSVPRFVDAPRI